MKGYCTVIQNELLLFEDSVRPIRFSLEEFNSDQRLQRKYLSLWEEFFCFNLEDSTPDQESHSGYVCLPPGSVPPLEKFASGKGSLLRVSYRGPSKDSPSAQISDVPCFTWNWLWNEIPERRASDPGGRVAELYRSKNGKQITSLMECRPGWILEAHCHDSEVFPFCFRGGGQLNLGGQTIEVWEKQLVRIPAETQHSFETGPHGAWFIIFVFESMAGVNS